MKTEPLDAMRNARAVWDQMQAEIKQKELDLPTEILRCDNDIFSFFHGVNWLSVSLGDSATDGLSMWSNQERG